MPTQQVPGPPRKRACRPWECAGSALHCVRRRGHQDIPLLQTPLQLPHVPALSPLSRNTQKGCKNDHSFPCPSKKNLLVLKARPV